MCHGVSLGQQRLESHLHLNKPVSVDHVQNLSSSACLVLGHSRHPFNFTGFPWGPPPAPKELRSSLLSRTFTLATFCWAQLHQKLDRLKPRGIQRFQSAWCLRSLTRGCLKISRLHFTVSQTNLAWSNIAGGLKHKLHQITMSCWNTQ